MGFDLERFEGAVDPDFACKLCGKVLEDPLTTPCGHVFCAACVLRWLSKSNSCPVQCQKVSTKELNHVLPLKNLILKLNIKCDHHERGCNKVMQLQHLSEHIGVCDFSPVKCGNKGCDAVLSLKDITSHMREQCEHRPVELCKHGCGLMLSLKEKTEGHCCLRALKTHSGVLQGKVMSLERQLKRQCLRFSNRERSLISKLSALHCELHMTALRFQKKITEYKSRIDALSDSWIPFSEGEETVTLKVTLHRVSGSLGFNIIGGRSCEKQEEDFCDGIYISKVVESGPAEKSGLHVHDRIVEVNGRNLFQATHDQAVEAFQTAKEPIEVQVLRRTAHKIHASVQEVDNSTQTNITLKYLKHIEAMAQLSSPSVPLGMAVLDSYYLPSHCHETRQDPPSSPDLFDGIQKDIKSGGFEYEVSLQSSTQDKLGLMLRCLEDKKTGVFVSEIDPEGVAAKDGRIQEGDRIIQINGVDIQSHEEAMALLRETGSKTVTFLLARPESQGDFWLEEDKKNFLNDLYMDLLEHHQAMEFTETMQEESRHDDDGGTTDTATMLSNRLEKDSGVGRTDDSTRNDESSEQEILGDDLTCVCHTLPGKNNKFNYTQDTMGSEDMNLSNDSFLSVDNGDSGNFLDIPGMACKHFRELLELKCMVKGNGPSKNLKSDARLYGDRVSLDCDDLDVQILNEELLNIELECLSIIQAHRLQTGERKQPNNNVGTKHLTEQKSVEKVPKDLINKQMDKESSSAYNTGESCWSIPPAVELSHDLQNMVKEDKSRSSPTHFTFNTHNLTTACSKQPLSPIQETSPTKSPFSPGNSESVNVEKTKQSGRKNPGKSQSPYKHAYIPAHAQHYQSYMHLIQQKSAVEYAQSQISLVSLSKNPGTYPSDSKPKMEWKVKIRSNGTRYITKRPNRDELLKERALRIQEERSGLTTDDDAASELKLGRYWNKEERKQHAAKAKEQRQQRERMKQGRMESKEDAGAMNNKKAPNIIQLSHKKMMKKRNKRILDNWMTIQELLTHGTKSTDGTRLYNSFLSVTTV